MSRHRKRRKPTLTDPAVDTRTPTGILQYQWCPGPPLPWVSVEPAITLIYHEPGRTVNEADAGGCLQVTDYFYGYPDVIIHKKGSDHVASE